MVRFCKNCNRAIDDLDKFCRECGYSTEDSLDYHTHYDLFNKESPSTPSSSSADIVKNFPKIQEDVGDFFHVLTKEDLEKELSRIQKEFEMPPEEFYKAWKDGKLHGYNAMKLGYYYEMYIEDYGPFENIKEEKKEKEKREGNKEDKYDLTNKIKIYDEGALDINWAWPEDEISEEERQVSIEEIKKDNQELKSRRIELPDEVNDKLGALLREDKGQKEAIQYLINRYSRKEEIVGGGVGERSVGERSEVEENIESTSVDVPVGVPGSISIIPKEEVTRIGRARGKTGEPYKMYDKAIHNFIPDILEKIEHSKDGIIRIKLKDIARQMGDQFITKRPVTLYTGLKYSLFDHNIVVQMGSLKEIDPETNKNVKVLLMRMKNPSDKLPPSIEQRKAN